MPGVFYAAPTSVPPLVGPPLVARCDFVWHGWDGTVWDIGDPASGVRLGAGARGLTMPPITWFTSESAGTDGARDRGFRVAPRPVFWPLRVYQRAKSQAWLDYDRAWWQTLQPGKTGIWEAVQPNGTKRRLTLRLEDDGNPAFETDPALTGWMRYAVNLRANQPLWEGDPIQRIWRASPSTADFFNAGAAPPYQITSGSTLGSATIDNPGDVDAWPVWTITGPTPSVSVGVGGRLVEVPFVLAADQTLTIDTAPTAQTAIDSSGVERTGELGARDYAPIPVGQPVPLSLAMAGSGTVQCAIVPKYFRAW